MPCQCGTTGAVAGGADSAYGGCDCATESDAGCACGGADAPSPSREASLERVVMELDKRVRALEARR